MQDEDYAPTLPVPKEFWEYENWAYDNYSELVRMYPDQWVAVVSKKVVVAGKNASGVVELAEGKTHGKDSPCLLE